jgi:hypothetical protein
VVHPNFVLNSGNVFVKQIWVVMVPMILQQRLLQLLLVHQHHRVTVKELIVLRHPTPTSLFASVGFNAVTVVVNSVTMETETLAQS